VGTVFYAHSLPEEESQERWEPLGVHLQEVSALCRKFCAVFRAEDMGLAAGYLHDIGKYRLSFQKYLEKKGPSAPHASVGAAVAHDRYPPPFGTILGIVAHSHHAGLPGEDGTGSHHARLSDGEAVDDLAPGAVDGVPLPAHLTPPPALFAHPWDGFGAAFFTRMLFSALCDADFLRTEHFYASDRTATREAVATAADMSRLRAALDHYLKTLEGSAKAVPAITAARADILAACRQAADRAPGVFTLTVPTGAGKTLSSMAFALRHAETHGLRRVVTVIPFTSIIEQSAGVYRRAFGAALEGAVVEHHSAAPLPDHEPMGPARLRMAQENWDAPVVVTTTVQFFESLFSDRPARCRKLHNLARSVIVLDEVQALPPDLLTPCVAALSRLVRDYGATVVLCTATQPDLSAKALAYGLPQPVDIVPDSPALRAPFRRVTTETAGMLSDDALVERLRNEDQVLCIVDNRRHAADLYVALAGEDSPAKPDDLFHLSAGLCPADRRRALAAVQARLDQGVPVRLVSTQVVEAGVDIDFPTVFRAAAGIDSLAQAAGRCNRNGNRPTGRFVVFDHDRPLWLPELERRRGLGRPLLAGGEDPLSPETVARYFAEVLAVENTDARGIMPLLDRAMLNGDWDFREAARRFRLIDEDTVPVIVPAEGAEDLCDALEAARRGGYPVPMTTLRALQQVSVSVYRGAFSALERAQALGRLGPEDGFVRLVDESLYHPRLGLRTPEGTRSFEDNVL
jgi:CRISPR-associated endonuclease/helicase Cas3